MYIFLYVHSDVLYTSVNNEIYIKLSQILFCHVKRRNPRKEIYSMANTLHKAKREKNDEFYTRYEDVEKELLHYVEQLKGKTIYCNCDSPEISAFWAYFHRNFGVLGLQKLISTHYDDNNPTYKMVYTGGGDEDITMGEKTMLNGNGDFCSDECFSLLDEADIVITNPPFSLFREFVHLISEHEIDFIIIGNTNALVYSEVFELFQRNKMRTGYTNFNIGMYFRVPCHYKYSKIIDGEPCVRVSSSCWYTTLPVEKHKEKLELKKVYSEQDYPKYDNYDAININNYNDIPMDYNGIMGVPVTFLDKYNPEQFEIIGLSSKPHSENVPRIHGNAYYKGYTRGRVVTRIESNLPLLRTSDFGGTKCVKDGCPDLYQMYWRVFVRRKV